MKITCALEMLLSNPENYDKQPVREIHLLLQDLESGDDQLPTEEQIASWSKQSDDESWLDIKFEDLEKALGNRSQVTGQPAKPSFADLKIGGNAFQDNIKHRFEKFNKFVDDRGMDFDDDESDESGDEDEEVGLDPVQYEKTMREALGLPVAAGSSQEAAMERMEELQENDEEAGMQEQELAELQKAMEAELFGLGALQRGLPEDLHKADIDRAGMGGELRDLVEELSNDGEGDEDIQVDFDLARSMLAKLEGRRSTDAEKGHGQNDRVSRTE